jgi:hypothetical protein
MEGLSFDHGCQLLMPKSAAFLNAVQGWVDAGTWLRLGWVAFLLSSIIWSRMPHMLQHGKMQQAGERVAFKFPTLARNFARPHSFSCFLPQGRQHHGGAGLAGWTAAQAPSRPGQGKPPQEPELQAAKQLARLRLSSSPRASWAACSLGQSTLGSPACRLSVPKWSSS